MRPPERGGAAVRPFLPMLICAGSMTSRAAFTASALLQGMAVMAGSTTTQMTVHTTVVTGCTVSAAPVAFGNYMPGAGASASNAAIKVSCTNGRATRRSARATAPALERR